MGGVLASDLGQDDGSTWMRIDEVGEVIYSVIDYTPETVRRVVLCDFIPGELLVLALLEFGGGHGWLWRWIKEREKAK